MFSYAALMLCFRMGRLFFSLITDSSMPIQSVPFPPWVSWWRENPHATSLVAGAVAGMTAEAVLFPLDCFKTRVQSTGGFKTAGGFKGAYRGVGTAIAGSAPASAIFFMTYEFTKESLAFYSDSG